ncbi:glycosyltransferase [Caballeronia sp. LZ028]|jgi:glycosyltransferase involved in cell wall biosynthesis|uniref:glycosyltransferase n=1 Tax=Caballeronia sp. LZ028 TaxID=3038563 RepID=UPI00286A0ED5|nr:glycosyltransferase [Caballeronia sp. LZ028]
MITVIIPAHNEADVIAPCVRSVRAASEHPQLKGEKVLVIVVADACTDCTEALAAAAGALVISIFKRNVGSARALGAELAIAHGARWLAFTDADTAVPPNWLSAQLQCDADAVCGVIDVVDWTEHSEDVRADFYSTYRDFDGHRHIHGANLGCSVAAYTKAGGFQSLAYDEDVALVDALVATNATIAWSNLVRVVTSARLDSRTLRGFGATLRAVSLRLSEPAPVVGPNRTGDNRVPCPSRRKGDAHESATLRSPVQAAP